MLIEDVEDRVRIYTPEEDERLAHQLRVLTEACHGGTLAPISLALLYDLHRRLFDGVRSHAGRPRTFAFGDEHLVFGPNRSVHRDAVASQLEEVFAFLERSMASFAANPDDPRYERSALHSPCGRMQRSCGSIHSSTGTAARRAC